MKYFIVSDTHSFYTELKEGLDDAGYDINNPEHCFVLNGDLFDRGEESAEILKFVRSIPKERRVLIRGNHEYLLKQLADKVFPESHDFSNGTVFTMFQLYKDRHPKTKVFKNYNQFWSDPDNYSIFNMNWIEVQKFNNYFEGTLDKRTWNMIRNDLKQSQLIEWIFESDEWVNYLELDQYIITHAFIPLYESHGSYHDYARYEPNWRECATRRQWIEATWKCPYWLIDDGYFDKEIEKGKRLVCGHWHASDFHWHYGGSDKDNTIFYGENVIAIDSCTVLSGFVNVLVLEE